MSGHRLEMCKVPCGAEGDLDDNILADALSSSFVKNTLKRKADEEDDGGRLGRADALKADRVEGVECESGTGAPYCPVAMVDIMAENVVEECAPTGGVDSEEFAPLFIGLVSTSQSHIGCHAAKMQNPSAEEVMEHLKKSAVFVSSNEAKVKWHVQKILQLSSLLGQLHIDKVLILYVEKQADGRDPSFLDCGGSLEVQDVNKFVTALISILNTKHTRDDKIRKVFGILRVMGVSPVKGVDIQEYCTIDPAEENSGLTMLHFKKWRFQEDPKNWQRTSRFAARK